jgi:hypothetical protein
MVRIFIQSVKVDNQIMPQGKPDQSVGDELIGKRKSTKDARKIQGSDFR